jgi:hypothetical protein
MSSNVRSFHFPYFQEKNKTIIIIDNKPVPGITKLSTQQNRAMHGGIAGVMIRSS